jgi:hypothetical protein
MFWTRTPLYYSESPDVPATILITVPKAVSEIEWNVLQIAAMVKGAGVALQYLFPFAEFTSDGYYAGAEAEQFREFFAEERDIPSDGSDYHAGAMAEHIKVFYFDGSEIPDSVVSYDAGAPWEFLSELFTEVLPMPDTAASYDGGALCEYIKEAYRENG